MCACVRGKQQMIESSSCALNSDSDSLWEKEEVAVGETALWWGTGRGEEGRPAGVRQPQEPIT